MPGDGLYPLKLAIEHLRYDLASDDAVHARLDLEFLERRLDELQRVIATDRAMLALDEVEIALIDATKAVAAVSAEAQGDMRAELARLALRAQADLDRWRTELGGQDPKIAVVADLAKTIGEAASNPAITSAELLLILSGTASSAADASSGGIEIAARSIALPPELAAKHRPTFTGKHAEIDCNQCHVGGQTKGLSAACASCHEDKHRGQV